MSRTFTSVDDRVLCEVIAQAREHLVFVAPGLRPPVAEALARAMTVVLTSSIHLVFDIDAKVYRLGYGDKDFKGMELLQAAAAEYSLTVNHHPGIRIAYAAFSLAGSGANTRSRSFPSDASAFQASSSHS